MNAELNDRLRRMNFKTFHLFTIHSYFFTTFNPFHRYAVPLPPQENL